MEPLIDSSKAGIESGFGCGGQKQKASSRSLQLVGPPKAGGQSSKEPQPSKS